MIINTIKQEIVLSAACPMEIIEPDRIKKSYRFSSESRLFSGHFPGFPILPAFIQVLMAQALIEEHKRCSVSLKSIENAKFRIPLGPDQKITVECRERFDGKCYDINVMVNEKAAASFRIYIFITE